MQKIMQKVTLIGMASILASGLAHAVPCNGFEIKLKNNTSDVLLAHKIELTGAQLQPGGIQKLEPNQEQAFTVNQSVSGRKMEGTIELHSISLPSKKVLIRFNLKNDVLFCEHNDEGSNSDYGLGKTRLPGNITYKIGK